MFWSDLYYQGKEVIDWSNSKLIPYMSFEIEEGSWVEYQLGEFSLSTPTRKLEGGQIVRSIDLYDDSIKIVDYKFDKPYKIKVGTSYDTAIKQLLDVAGVTKQNIQPIGESIEVDIVYEGGTSYMDAINDLLRRVTYVPIFVDSLGYFTSFKYYKPTEKYPDFSFYDNEYSIVFDGVEEQYDTFNVPNKFVMVHSNPQKKIVWRSVIVNNDPNSPTSIQNAGRTIVSYKEINEIKSQKELQNLNEKDAFERSQVYGTIIFSTALVPNFEMYDTIEFGNTDLAIDDKFLVTRFTMELKVGGKMTFEARKVVDLDVQHE